MKRIFDFLYGTEKFQIEFDVPIDVAVTNLQSKVSGSVLSLLGSEGMVGQVSNHTVKLQRFIPMVGNSFKPFLIGSFSTCGNKTVLSGAFRFHRLVQAFLTFWFTFSVLLIASLSMTAFANPSEAWFVPFLGVLCLVGGVAIVNIGRWFARNDKEWLKASIRSAILKGQSQSGRI